MLQDDCQLVGSEKKLGDKNCHFSTAQTRRVMYLSLKGVQDWARTGRLQFFEKWGILLLLFAAGTIQNNSLP